MKQILIFISSVILNATKLLNDTCIFVCKCRLSSLCALYCSLTVLTYMADDKHKEILLRPGVCCCITL